MWKRQQQSNTNQAFRAPDFQNSMLSRHQKEKNICEWLEQLNCNEDLNITRMSASPTNSTNWAFDQSAQKPMQFTMNKN